MLTCAGTLAPGGAPLARRAQQLGFPIGHSLPDIRDFATADTLEGLAAAIMLPVNLGEERQSGGLELSFPRFFGDGDSLLSELSSPVDLLEL